MIVLSQTEREDVNIGSLLIGEKIPVLLGIILPHATPVMHRADLVGIASVGPGSRGLSPCADRGAEIGGMRGFGSKPE